jgi:hypothetical protein
MWPRLSLSTATPRKHFVHSITLHLYLYTPHVSVHHHTIQRTSALYTKPTMTLLFDALHCVAPCPRPDPPVQASAPYHQLHSTPLSRILHDRNKRWNETPYLSTKCNICQRTLCRIILVCLTNRNKSYLKHIVGHAWSQSSTIIMPNLAHPFSQTM